jgi:hypothetical protein
MDMKRLLIFIFLLALSACSTEKPADTEERKTAGPGAVQAPGTAPSPASVDAYSLEIIQAKDVTRATLLTLRVNGFDPAYARFEWLVNGVAVASGTTLSMKNVAAHKGDALQAKAYFEGKEVLSDSTTINNTPPEVTKVKIMPEVFKPGDTLSIDVTGDDVDGDPVEMLIEWTRNGELVCKGRCLEGPVKRGDRISVKITPFDGEKYGTSVILNREIKNMPPMIVDDKNIGFDGKTLRYQCKASDPDQDQLAYSLRSAPPGMTIDTGTGQITWNVPPDFKGKASFTACANDGRGGEAVHTYTVDIK